MADTPFSDSYIETDAELEALIGADPRAASPSEFDFICEADWKNLCGDQKEADYIKALGLVVSG